jgi:hypothetical protein
MVSLAVALLAAFLAATLAATFVTLAAATLLTAALFTATTLIAFTIVCHISPLFDLNHVFVSRLHSFKTWLQPALITCKENATLIL